MLDTTYFDAYDSGTFRNFCAPAQLHKDLNTLYGLIVGIQADGHINETEIELLHSWVNSIGTLKSKAPYFKLVAKINEILEDGIVTVEEAEDLIWLCRSYLDYNTNPYYDVITSATQQLGGFLAGISADNTINAGELNALRNWSSENESLFNTWPFDALLPAIDRISADRQLPADEHGELLSFCRSVSAIKPVGQTKTETVAKLPMQAVSILIQDSTFCFTGESPNYTRKELAKIVEMYGGVAAASVTTQLHYLVICDVPNPAWAFQMYGRKVEKAMNMKKKGSGPEVVFEQDLLDVLKTFGYS
ncbi:BRCT domain-containing protein [Dyadobacter sp. 3J3]|uniref:BRCT domain-containing protein n=1 Tax=Dyadobacter sp. 3J3 TaxID=2606600 RepID=UPI00135B4009|nr:BRCT domain-containing protein [Dyadobacter sp. 3J3]